MRQSKQNQTAENASTRSSDDLDTTQRLKNELISAKAINDGFHYDWQHIPSSKRPLDWDHAFTIRAKDDAILSFFERNGLLPGNPYDWRTAIDALIATLQRKKLWTDAETIRFAVSLCEYRLSVETWRTTDAANAMHALAAYKHINHERLIDLVQAQNRIACFEADDFLSRLVSHYGQAFSDELHRRMPSHGEWK